ncbi:GNAT family N-acetyltransferase [Phytomonospora sp. NPDC050363]|uniref:GNAT family N-acetyltransferase n=1 Tax=Phytomonospora sp. NPDC050363 TaxID=3155642 RepID=UPI0033C11BF1
MSSVTFRRIEAGESELFTRFPHAPHPEVGREAKQDYLTCLSEDRARPEWTWVALRDGETIARAAFWGRPGAAHPSSLDWFEPGDAPAEVAVELLKRAYAETTNADGERPEYSLIVPPDWRERPEIAAEAHKRVAAVEGAGMVAFVERWGYTWETADGLPERGDRLEFAPAGDAELLAAITASLAGTFDAHDREAIETEGVEAAGKASWAFLTSLSGREHFRLAHDRDGATVGAIFPTNVPSGRASIGYIAVLPEHRGKGFVNELLAEMVHSHVGRGAALITGNTDQVNVPMAKAFNRAGFRTTSAQIDFR